MADDIGLVRSNYFRVKDRAAFDAWLATLVGDVSLYGRREEDPAEIVGLYCQDGFWPSSRILEKNPAEDDDDAETLCDEDDSIDFADELAKHLADGEICVLVDAGFCRARYAYGYAIAFDNTGKYTSVGLNDIYEKAKAMFGVEPTKAEY